MWEATLVEGAFFKSNRSFLLNNQVGSIIAQHIKEPTFLFIWLNLFTKLWRTNAERRDRCLWFTSWWGYHLGQSNGRKFEKVDIIGHTISLIQSVQILCLIWWGSISAVIFALVHLLHVLWLFLGDGLWSFNLFYFAKWACLTILTYMEWRSITSLLHIYFSTNFA